MAKYSAKTTVELGPRGWFYLAQQSQREALICSDPEKAKELKAETAFRMRRALEEFLTTTPKAFAVKGKVISIQQGLPRRGTMTGPGLEVGREAEETGRSSGRQSRLHLA